jgi:aspartyl-tRNA(Asn)/glutamyl-tRNA(Gln) amidotransferase subunit A
MHSVDDDICFESATALGQRLRCGELNAVWLCEQFLERARRLDPILNAFRLRLESRALAAAEAAERQLRAGICLGPLHGVPYVTKDLIDVAGEPTTAGSRALEGNIAHIDATVTQKLAAAGAVLLGKTNTVEFAFGSVGINHSHGTPHNPWAEVHHVPGGSSSGSAVAVAAGMAALATGTDTACSVRTPASLCGVVGLKTTVGRVSRAGVYPLSSTLDSVGPLARRVEDTAVLFSLMQGTDTRDPATAGVKSIDVLTTLKLGARGLRVAIAEGLLFEDLAPEVDRAVRAAADTFASLGAEVTSIDFAEARSVMATPNVISMVEGYCQNAALLESAADELDPIVRQRMQPGAKVSAVDYRRALDALLPLRASADRHFDRVDVLLAPTVMIPALPLATVDRDFETYMSFAGRYLRNCFPGNLLNLCAVTLPCGFTSGGLPVGLMLYGRAFREDLVLRAAHAFESTDEWQGIRPDLSWTAQVSDRDGPGGRSA